MRWTVMSFGLIVESSTYWKLILKASWRRACSMSSLPPSTDIWLSAFTTPMYSMYDGTSFMAMKAKKPSTSRTMTKLIRVIPDCLDFMFPVSAARGGSPVQDRECRRGAPGAPQRRLPCPERSATPCDVTEATVRSMDDLAHPGEVDQ